MFYDEGGTYYYGADGQKHYINEFYAPKSMTVVAPGDKIELSYYNF